MCEAASAPVGRPRVCPGWLLGISILAAASAVAWAMVVYADAPWFASCVLTAAVGGILHRLARVNTAGIVIWSMVALSTASSVCLPDVAFGLLALLCTLAAMVLSAISVIVFLVAAAKDRTRRGRNCACCNLVLFTLVVGATSGAKISGHLRHQEAARHTTETLVKLNKLGVEIESIRSRLGRLPKDEEELVALRGRPMPTFREQFQIHYSRCDGDHYYLECCVNDFWGRAWDIMGWIVYYHGPNSPRRIQVVSF